AEDELGARALHGDHYNGRPASEEGPLSELSNMTWEEARALAGGRAVAILPVGAIEAHGPHLPLATDVIIAEAMARAGAERLLARGVAALVLPAPAYTTGGVGAGWA